MDLLFILGNHLLPIKTKKMKLRKKTLLVMSAFGIAILLVQLLAFNPAPLPEKYSIESEFPPNPKWENLQVLPNDISRDSLLEMMERFSVSLSVKCTYCHVPDPNRPGKLDFPSDEKIEKEIARGMIAMTDEINEKYFKPHFPDPKPEHVEVISCVVCHRGSPNPELYLSKMGDMYKTYQEGRDNRKEMLLKEMQKE